MYGVLWYLKTSELKLVIITSIQCFDFCSLNLPELETEMDQCFPRLKLTYIDELLYAYIKHKGTALSVEVRLESSEVANRLKYF